MTTVIWAIRIAAESACKATSAEDAYEGATVRLLAETLDSNPFTVAETGRLSVALFELSASHGKGDK